MSQVQQIIKHKRSVEEYRNNIVAFAEEVLNKNLFEYEVSILRNYAKLIEDYDIFTQWVRPTEVKKQFLLNIWYEWNRYTNQDVPEYVHFRRFDII